MELLRFANVRKDYGHREVLHDVSFRIGESDKLGLIGPNGAGKTSILRLLTGEEPQNSGPNGGVITRSPGLRIGYVPQLVVHDDALTVREAVLVEHTAAASTMHSAAETLAAATSSDVARATSAYEAAQDAYERAGGDAMHARATAMLDALGLSGREEQRVGSLSGGEKSTLALARALLAEPELLVLDEPGNHLDFAGIAWLENFLAAFRGAVLIVSHNRYLLDRVATGILQLEAGVVKHYVGNYSAYRAAQLRDKISQQKDYVVNQRRLAQLEELVKRFEEYARRTGDAAWGKRLRARRSQLERERADAVEKPLEEASRLRMSLTAEKSRADIALQVRGYSRSFGDLRLFDAADLEIRSGERVAIIGPNGSGKSTLLREVIAEGAWDHAHLRIGPSMRVGYCAQEQEVLDDDRSVFEEIVADGTVSPDRALTLLMQFLFRRDDQSKRVGDLSGGERNRLQLAKLMTKQPNFLILDEPTNHLDIPACEAIEEVLTDFKGTILAVSHDRYFLDKIVNRVVEVREGALVSYDGNFSEYWQERQTSAPRATSRVSTRRTARERPQQPSRATPARKPDDALAARIAAAEHEKLDLERKASQAFTRGDHREGSRLAGLLERQTALIDKLYAQWVESEK
ncbi:MAG TPA: ABC-F family ATP-binding cassette domain-containing protein [Dehalococcoidia bacterium]